MSARKISKIVQDNAKGVEITQNPGDYTANGEEGDFDRLFLDLDGYEGPIDVLLELSRKQKVDLARISILQLVRQYLEFIEQARERKLELAAEYLVMAAWMAYLKSRLFFPEEENDDEPSAEAMADALQFQLRRLEAMQDALGKLMERPQLGVGVFARAKGSGKGVADNLDKVVVTRWQVSLLDLLQAYGDISRREKDKEYELPVFSLMSTEKAHGRLAKMLGALPRERGYSKWASLDSFLPKEEGVSGDILYARSALASTFTAGLEMAKQGGVEFRQEGTFRPVYLRARSGFDMENLEKNEEAKTEKINE